MALVKLYVGGFPLEITEMELVQMVGPYVDVSTIKIVRDKKTRICKGYAFLEVTSQEGAEAAIEALDGYKMGTRELRLSIVEDAPAPPPRSYVKVAPRTGPPRKMRPRKS